MSVASKKRRRVARGGMLGHLARLSARIKPLRLDTAEERFADAMLRGWPVYAHPDVASQARGAGLVVLDHAMMPRGTLVAVKPAAHHTVLVAELDAIEARWRWEGGR